MRSTVFRELDATYPGRIVNKTNGITFRRWLFEANPGLTELIAEAVGDQAWDDADSLTRLKEVAAEDGFVTQLAQVRRANKEALARLIRRNTGIKCDPSMLFDVQIKRIHEYKRQLLNLLETVALFHAIRAEPGKDWVPRVKIFAGKAAASYAQAKLIIKLANDVGRLVNSDPLVGDRLKVVFLPNYNVSLAQAIIPAADLSEQISTAGMEASGTGNMKLALNGALTIGTLDGANIEIRDKVGPENIFIFGLDAEEVETRRRAGLLGRDVAAESPRLEEAIESIAAGLFSPDDPARFRPLTDAMLGADVFMIAADFEAYWQAQRAIDDAWRNVPSWWRMSVSNTAGMSWFSSDRTIREYAEEIWRVPIRPEKSLQRN
jgi:starch phosphorylase